MGDGVEISFCHGYAHPRTSMFIHICMYNIRVYKNNAHTHDDNDIVRLRDKVALGVFAMFSLVDWVVVYARDIYL